MSETVLRRLGGGFRLAGHCSRAHRYGTDILSVLRLLILNLRKRGCITTMRAPNILLFLLALILAFVGVWEHLNLPVRDVALPVIGSTAKLYSSLKDYTFWLVFSAWVLLAFGALFPRRSRSRAAVLARA